MLLFSFKVQTIFTKTVRYFNLILSSAQVKGIYLKTTSVNLHLVYLIDWLIDIGCNHFLGYILKTYLSTANFINLNICFSLKLINYFNRFCQKKSPSYVKNCGCVILQTFSLFLFLSVYLCLSVFLFVCLLHYLLIIPILWIFCLGFDKDKFFSCPFMSGQK